LKYYLLIIALVLFACNKDDDATPAPPIPSLEHESYRAYLWEHMFFSQWSFEFVGSRVDSDFYPGMLGLLFDRDHEGVSGIQTQGVLDNLENTLSVSPTPDVVLLGLGGNDLQAGQKKVSEVITNLHTIINRLQTQNPRVIIFIEQIAPIKDKLKFRKLTRKVIEFNEAIPHLAQATATNQSKVIVVDMHTGWKRHFFADDVHYNKRGAIEAASRYFFSIHQHLNPLTHYTIMPIGDSRVEGNRPNAPDDLVLEL
jgi:lysophospholipase L1-like esterase